MSETATQSAPAGAIKGITLRKGPAAQKADAGMFNLPHQFDSTKYASRWQEEGNPTEMDRQPEYIKGTPFVAEGWEIWKYPPDAGLKANSPATVILPKKKYVLLFRPRSVQDGVNALYGNVSKRHLVQEHSGQTIGMQPVADTGMLAPAAIDRHSGGLKEFGGDDSLHLKDNPVELDGARVPQTPQQISAQT